MQLLDAYLHAILSFYTCSFDLNKLAFHVLGFALFLFMIFELLTHAKACRKIRFSCLGLIAIGLLGLAPSIWFARL